MQHFKLFLIAGIVLSNNALFGAEALDLKSQVQAYKENFRKQLSDMKKPTPLTHCFMVVNEREHAALVAVARPQVKQQLTVLSARSFIPENLLTSFVLYRVWEAADKAQNTSELEAVKQNGESIKQHLGGLTSSSECITYLTITVPTILGIMSATNSSAAASSSSAE